MASGEWFVIGVELLLELLGSEELLLSASELLLTASELLDEEETAARFLNPVISC